MASAKKPVFSYCPKCGNGLAAATIDEIVEESQVCPRCKTALHPNRDDRDLLREILERIKYLEELMTPLAMMH